MRPPIRPLAIAALTLVAVAACSTPTGTSTATPGPGQTSAGQATQPIVAGERCSYLTAQEVGAIVGMAPVLVDERAGRGDCDFLFAADGSAKVNIGVFDWADRQSTFETTKALGEAASVDIGDEAYSIFNESIGTVVLVRASQTLITVQAFGTGDQAAQLEHAEALAQALYHKL